MTLVAAAAEGLHAVEAGADLLARLGEALKRDELAQRIRAMGHVDDQARDDRRRDERWRLRRVHDASGALARAVELDDAGGTFAALLQLVELGVDLDELAAVAELAGHLLRPPTP